VLQANHPERKGTMSPDIPKSQEQLRGFAARLSRRQVLLGFAALVVSSQLGTGWAAPAATDATSSLSPDDLTNMVSALCGIDAGDSSMIKPYLEAVGPGETLQELTRLAAVVKANPGDGMDQAIADAHLESMANAVVAAFYSGEMPGPAGEKVLSYLDALVWQAVESFTKPPSVCGGAFGYWADPPQSEATQS
jgi:hypothetical protein